MVVLSGLVDFLGLFQTQLYAVAVSTFHGEELAPSSQLAHLPA
jgi:hypothetical protein